MADDDAFDPSDWNRCPDSCTCIVNSREESKPTGTAKIRWMLRSSSPALTRSTIASATSATTSNRRVR